MECGLSFAASFVSCTNSLSFSTHEQSNPHKLFTWEWVAAEYRKRQIPAVAWLYNRQKIGWISDRSMVYIPPVSFAKGLTPVLIRRTNTSMITVSLLFFSLSSFCWKPEIALKVTLKSHFLYLPRCFVWVSILDLWPQPQVNCLVVQLLFVILYSLRSVKRKSKLVDHLFTKLTSIL